MPGRPSAIRARSGPVARSGPEDDAALLARVAGGDLRAFESLYRAYHPRLTRFLANILRRTHLVEEALNDTMLVVWTRPQAYNGACKVSTWIFAIAYRKALKTLRRRDDPLPDERSRFLPSQAADPEQELRRGQSQVRLMQAIGELSPAHRAVVDLTYFHEIGYREIAEIMACPIDTVKTRMFHARRHLRERMAGGLTDWL